MRAGDILGDRYVLEHVLGQGGMGVVWAARDRQSGIRVALKLILRGDKNDKEQEATWNELRLRLRREALACMKVQHPHIVRVIDVAMDETERHGPYMVLELLEGQTLGERIKQTRRVEPKLAARIAADVASCLAAAHAANIVHRDLKPANIFLHRERDLAEDEFITKVLDFGVCKDDGAVENAKTKTGVIVGSLAYMSPEQALRSKDVDFRADIWALGVVLYEMLTGMRAFSGSVENVLAQHLEIVVGRNKQPVPAPSSKVRDVSPELDAIVARCTKGKPSERYANAEELARDLYAVAEVPMPVRRQPSATRPSLAAHSGVSDMFDDVIKESKAVPDVGAERRFNPMAQTMPLRGMAKHVEAPSIRVVEEDGDLASTIRMQPKVVSAPRPAALDEDAVLRTQMLAPDAPIPSPEPEWKRALEAHRQSSAELPAAIFADVDASDGNTQMIASETLPLAANSPDRSVTTSASGAISQDVVAALPRMKMDPVVTISRRRRRNRLALIGASGFLLSALVLMVGVLIYRDKPGAVNASEVPSASSAVVPPVEVSSANVVPVNMPLPPVTAEPVPSAAPAPVESAVVPPVPQTAPIPVPPPPPTTTAPPVKAAPTPVLSAAPPKPSLTTTTRKRQRTEVKCTGVGVFKKCKEVVVQ